MAASQLSEEIRAALDRIDWRSLGSQLKLANPTMKAGFSRIIKKINYDQDATGTLEEIAGRLAAADFPLLMHIVEILDKGKADADMPWEAFTFDHLGK